MKKINRYTKDRTLFYRLFVEAFPPIERLPIRTMMSYVKKKDVDLWNFYLEDEFVGFAYMLLSEKYAYLLFFATEESVRGKGIGSEIVKKLIDYYRDKSMVLDIEPVDPKSDNAEQRLKRLSFYEKLGFEVTDYEMTDYTGDYSILATDKEEFDIGKFHEMFEILPPIFDGTEIVKKKLRE